MSDRIVIDGNYYATPDENGVVENLEVHGRLTLAPGTLVVRNCYMRGEVA